MCFTDIIFQDGCRRHPRSEYRPCLQSVYCQRHPAGRIHVRHIDLPDPCSSCRAAIDQRSGSTVPICTHPKDIEGADLCRDCQASTWLVSLANQPAEAQHSEQSATRSAMDAQGRSLAPSTPVARSWNNGSRLPAISSSRTPVSEAHGPVTFDQRSPIILSSFQSRQSIIEAQFDAMSMVDFRRWLDRFLQEDIRQRNPHRVSGLTELRDDYEYDVWVSLIYDRKARYNQSPSWVQERLRNILVSREKLDNFIRDEMPDIAAEIIRFRDLRLAREARASGNMHRRPRR
ncbi:hypothetical protein KVT40_006452 [Elsinoe batatas]|uniref:Uncharacterized protein n=1 Tax=Elsinoe batatas TaxID=2601811 RepID=A0A8K0KXP4_9PEZI|nr:hypothetical protein KVT40_006452 [Elsinoe batatas]